MTNDCMVNSIGYVEATCSGKHPINIIEHKIRPVVWRRAEFPGIYAILCLGKPRGLCVILYIWFIYVFIYFILFLIFWFIYLCIYLVLSICLFTYLFIVFIYMYIYYIYIIFIFIIFIYIYYYVYITLRRLSAMYWQYWTWCQIRDQETEAKKSRISWMWICPRMGS